MSVSIPIITEFNGKGIAKAISEFKQLETTGQKALFAIKKAAVPATAALTVLGGAALKAAQMAGDLNETQSATNVVFGESAKVITDFSKRAAKELGLSQIAAQEAAQTFGGLAAAAGKTGPDVATFATQMTKLTADMASFKNTTPEDAIQAVGAALRGEMEPIRRYNVLLDDQTLRIRAVKMGLIDSVKTALTPANKTLAAQAEILAQTSIMQGDFARTSQGAAGQQKILKAELDNTVRSIGQAFVPVLETILPLLSGMAGFADRNADLFVTFAIALGGFATAIVAVRGALIAWNAIAIITRGINWALATSFTAVQVATGVGIGVAIAAAGAFVIIKEKMDKARAAADNYASGLSVLNSISWSVVRSQEQLSNFMGPVLTRDFKKLTGAVVETGTGLDKAKAKLDKIAAAKRKAAAAAKKLAEDVEQAKEAVGQKFADALEKGNDKLDEARERFDEYAKSVSGSVMAAINFGNAQSDSQNNVKDLSDALKVQTEAQAKLAKAMDVGTIQDQTEAMKDLEEANLDVEKAQAKPMTFFDNLKKQAIKAKDFSVLVNRLIAGGISDTALSQVLDAGVDAGTAIAEEILAGGQEAITGPEGVNALVQSAQDLADKTGQLAAKRFYQAGVDSAMALVSGIQSVINKYTPMLNVPGLSVAGVEMIGAQFDTDIANGPTQGVPNFSNWDAAGINSWIDLNLGNIMGNMQFLAQGGIVTKPTFAMIGEGGEPEAVIPLSKLGNMTGNNITINVNGGDPNAVVDALRRYMRQNGSVPITVSTP
jgi:hypothetical protein